MAKKTPKSNNSANEPSYEQLMDQLDAMVDRIESGELGLEESIKGYEQGIGLIKQARGILDRAQQRIVELNADSLDDADTE